MYYSVAWYNRVWCCVLLRVVLPSRREQTRATSSRRIVRTRSCFSSSSVLLKVRCPVTTSASATAPACDNDIAGGNANTEADTEAETETESDVCSSRFFFPEAFRCSMRILEYQIGEDSMYWSAVIYGVVKCSDVWCDVAWHCLYSERASVYRQ